MEPQNDNKNLATPADGSRHKVRCIHYEWAFTDDNKEQLALSLEIVDGELKGYIAHTYLSFTDAAREYSEQKMRALGWIGDDYTKLGTILSKTGVASFEHEVYEGKNRVRVGWINSIGAPVKNPMSRDQIAAFNERIHKRANGRPGAGAPPMHDDVPPPSDRDAPPPR